MRARDLVALGLDGHRIGIPLPSKHRRRQIDEILEAVDAQSFANARVGQLSGGEQQRVLIATLWYRSQSCCCWTNRLPTWTFGSEQEVVGLLTRVVTEQGIAVLISAHDMNPLLPVWTGWCMLLPAMLPAARRRNRASGRSQQALRTSCRRGASPQPYPGRRRDRMSPPRLLKMKVRSRR